MIVTDRDRRPTHPSRRNAGGRGAAWVVASFAACPCHLPLTLAALAAVLGGTTAGALLRDHGVLAGVLVTAVWALGTARGVWLLRQPTACPLPPSRPTPEPGSMSGSRTSRGPEDTRRP